MADDAVLAPVEGADDFGFDSEVEQPDETPEIEQPEGEEPTEGEEHEQTEEEKRDGRQTPDAIRKALKAFREGSPEHAKAAKVLNDAFGHAEAYKTVFPKVADAQAAHAAIQSFEPYGGVEGAQTTLVEIQEIDAMLADGDPAVLDHIAEIAGEGLNKLVPEILNRMQASNPQEYAEVLGPIVGQAVAQAGIPQYITQIWNALQNSRRADAPESFKKEHQEHADKLIEDLFKWSKEVGRTEPQTAKKTGAVDAKLSAREQAIEQKENATFDQEVGAAANETMNKGLTKELSPYLDKLNLTREAKQDLIDGIYAEVSKLAMADKDYQRNRDAARTAKNRSPQKVADIINAKFTQVLPQAVKAVVTRRYPNGIGGKPAVKKGATPTQPAAPGKPTLVKELPPQDQIDFTKTTDAMIVRGIRVLKSGKRSSFLAEPVSPSITRLRSGAVKHVVSGSSCSKVSVLSCRVQVTLTLQPGPSMNLN